MYSALASTLSLSSKKEVLFLKETLYLSNLLLGIIPSALVAAAEKKDWFFSVPPDKDKALVKVFPV
ncbi:hypothetical protein D3C85_1294880 [compost metagenome]